MEASSVQALTPTAEGDVVVHRFEFRGTATEYFKIWIVNIALSIVTLGIYSAWAKVRARRYFYGNTFLNGSAFDYHANPVAILKGRAIFGVFAVLYSMGGIYPPMRAVILVIAAAFPWLMVRGSVFNMSNTSYRGVRFGFAKDYKGAYKAYGTAALYWIFSLGVLAGVAMFKHEEFRATRSRFGKTPFTFAGDRWAYWRIYLQAMGLGLMGLVGFVVFIVGLVWVTGAERGAKDSVLHLIIGGVVLLWFYTMMAYILTYIRANTMNYVFAHTKLEGVRIQSKYSAWDLFLIYVGNFFACALTLGLAYPWARIELAKYRASTTAVIASPQAFDTFVQGSAAGGGSLGDQALDFWDIDLGF